MRLTRTVMTGLVAMVALGGLPVRGEVDTPPFEVPYGRRVTAVLTPAETERLLVVSAYLHSDRQRFDRREAGIAVNGRILPAAALRSPSDVLQPRTSQARFPRVDDTRQTVWFPWTHRPGGLADFDPVEHRVLENYQIWIPQYRDFNETIVIDLDAFPTPADGRYHITFYNNAARAIDRSDGRESGPLLKVLTAHAAETIPALDRGPYTAPIWQVLATDPELEQEARRRLDDAETPAVERARIAFQLALHEAFAGDMDASTTLLRTATAVAEPFPERHEAVYRLAVRDPDSAPDWLDEADDPFGWARLFNTWQAARGGAEAPAIVNVPPVEDLAVDAPGAADRLREGVDPLPVAHPVPGRAGEAEPPNSVVFRYSDAALLVTMRGPGTELLRPGNMPGQNRPVWEFNCFELFLAPGAEILDYYELNVSSANGRYDGRNHYHRHTPEEWDGSWQSAASIGDGLMEVVYRIPWSDLGREAAPPAGSLWVANVIRVQHLPAVAGGWDVAEFSLGPLTARDFHRLQDGVILRFQ